jgi:hypothetical protein
MPDIPYRDFRKLRAQAGVKRALCLVLRRLAVETIGLPCPPPRGSDQAFVVSAMAMDQRQVASVHQMEQLSVAAPSRKPLQLKGPICGVLCQRAEKIKILLIEFVGHRLSFWRFLWSAACHTPP